MNTKTLVIYVHSIIFILILSMEIWNYILHGTIFQAYRGGIQILAGVQPLSSNRNKHSIFSCPEHSIQKPWLLPSSLCITVYQYTCSYIQWICQPQSDLLYHVHVTACCINEYTH